MHQNPRPAQRNAASANNPATNPERTNNQRDTREAPPHRTRSSMDLTAYTERSAAAAATGESSRDAASADKERETGKLNQIIQNFHTKAALMICSSRAALPQAYNKNGEARQNRWFNVILNETDVLYDDLQDWRRPALYDDPPPPLEIEVYLDASQISQTQALVIVDEHGKHWDVAESLNSSADSSPRQGDAPGREIVLERWRIELGEADRYNAAQLNDLLPNVYKKGVVLFRSLFTFARFLPAWKLHRRLSRQPGSVQALKLRFRIRRGQGGSSVGLLRNSLFKPLCPSELHDSDNTITGHHAFPPLLCSAGPLSISVEYRHNTDLYVADAEALLSSRFAGIDASVDWGRDVGDRTGLHPRGLVRNASADVPSARPRDLAGDRNPSHRVLLGDIRSVPSRPPPPQGETSSRTRGSVAGGGPLASLGTYHTTESRSSPISALQHRGSDYSSMDGDQSRKVTPQSIPVRDFLKNPPFKAGSVATSPRNAATPSTSRPISQYGTSATTKRLSLNTLPQQALRHPSMNDPNTTSPGSSSPKPAPVQRFSSSFANRKKWTGTSRPGGESTTSSGHGSSSSKEKSGQLNEGTPGSSGSVRTDEDDIAAFVTTLEGSKNLKTFSSARKSTSPNTVNLSRFKSMTTQSSELADEMSSSSLIQTSLTPPSRRLSNVPGLSISSSPGRALTHVPHVRSRLSTHSIAEERDNRIEELAGAQEESDEDEPFMFQQDNLMD